MNYNSWLIGCEWQAKSWRWLLTPRNPKCITVSGQNLEQISSFVYVGATFTDDSSCLQDIWKRLAMGRSEWCNRYSRYVTRPTEVRLFTALIWSYGQLLHGSEGWIIHRAEVKQIEAFRNVVIQKSIESYVDSSPNKRVDSDKTASWEVTDSTRKTIKSRT